MSNCNLKFFDFKVQYTTAIYFGKVQIPVLGIVFYENTQSICQIKFDKVSDDLLERFSTFVARKEKDNLYKIDINTPYGIFKVYKVLGKKGLRYYAEREHVLYFREKCSDFNFENNLFKIFTFKYQHSLPDSKIINEITLLNLDFMDYIFYSMDNYFFSYSKYPIDYLKTKLLYNTISEQDLNELKLDLIDLPVESRDLDGFLKKLKNKVELINNIEHF